MIIRRSEERDLPEIFAIYESARAYMDSLGNAAQWGDGWPYENVVRGDVQDGTGYVAEENGEVVGVFHYRYGEDPEETYRRIDGKWRDGSPYGVVHRIASKYHGRSIGEAMLRFAVEKAGHLRIDTHEKNQPMQSLLQKLGFVYCGTIRVRDGSERLAFEVSKDRKQ